MARLAEYLKSFSALLGSEESVHFNKLGTGSTECVAYVDPPAFPKVTERLESVVTGEAPRSAMEAHGRIDELLAKDNAIGHVRLSGNNLIEFPGRRRAGQEVFGPVQRTSSVEGQIFSIGGRDETINIQLRDGDRETRCVVSISLARDLGPHLRGDKVRLFGRGYWSRMDGVWTMKSFTAESFVVLNECSLQSSIASIRRNFEGINPDEFMATVNELRHG